MPKDDGLTDAQRDGLKVLAGAGDHADSEGFVSQAAALDSEGHVIPKNVLDSLVEAGLIEQKHGVIDGWFKLTAEGKKAK